MPSIDDYPETPKLPGTHQAMLDRQKERLNGKLNPPLRGVRGLANLVAGMTGSKKKWYHPLDCICSWCLPADMRASVLCRKKSHALPKSMTPTHGNKARKGYGTPRKRWTDQRGTSSN